jgi:hypothetical protein
MNLVIEIGSPNTGLTFSKAANITFPGRAGMSLLESVNNGSPVAVTNVCGENSQTWADANLSTGNTCRIDVGSDVVVWTKHFSRFGFYQNGPAVSLGGGGAAAYSLNSSDLALLRQNSLLLDSGTSTGRVLGIKVYNFTKLLKLGSRGDEVSLLQFLLIKGKAGKSALALSRYGLTGYFGPATKQALIEYQKKFKLKPADGTLNKQTKVYFQSLSNSLKVSISKLSKNTK